MKYNREECKAQIEASPLFMLNKDTEYVAYSRESLRMVENLYCYLLAINESAYEPFGLEIYTLAAECIKNYDATKGKFLHYFNAAWKREYSRIQRNQKEDEFRRGVHVSEDDCRNVRKYMRLKRAEQDSSACGNEERYHKLVAVLGQPVDKIRYMDELSSMNVCSDTYTNGEGEEQSVWDTLSTKGSFVDELESDEEIEAIFQEIDKQYGCLQERQKGIVSDVITIRVCPDINWERIQQQQYSFLNKSIVENWLKNGKLPTQREIAEKYGRNEASISRTINKFIEKLREKQTWD